MKKSVTLEGDSFDPAGTLSGGSRAQSSSVLAAVSKLVSVSEQREEVSKQLNDINKHLSNINKVKP